MIRWSRFILRLLALAVAMGACVLSVSFFYQFHLLTVDQVSELLNVVTNQPILSIKVGIGLILFVLSLLGFILLLQYPLWRYPLSIFIGYAVGCYLYYQFYLMQPFAENILQLNDFAWYYPLVITTALLFRGIIGLIIPRVKKQTIPSNSE